MATGTIATAVIAAIIGIFFIIGIRSIVRRFSSKSGDCCSGSCSSCSSCHSALPKKRQEITK